MPLKQKHKKTHTRARGLSARKDFWHRIPEEKRITVLLSTAVILFGFFYTLMLTSATGGSSWVGFTVLNSGSSFTLNLIAIPEKRARTIPGTNNSGTLLAVEVRNPGVASPLFTDTITTSSGGTYSGLAVPLAPGTYDITAKGFSHLRIKKSSQTLDTGVTVDFTNAGASPLLSGDTNDDNVVNSIDISQIVAGVTTYSLKTDLNRDTVVNSIDITNAVTNVFLTGAT